MSIFAKIRSGKKAAEEHKAQQAAKDAAESTTQEPPAPYHHVPKHAAQDAIAGTPGAADKDAIREANKQRVLYSRDTFYSASSPNLNLPRGARTPRAEDGSRSSSRARPPLQDRRSHPGYASYQSLGLTQQERRSRANSRYGKSPLSSVPITPRDSSAASSSSSASSVSRNYNDPIEHAAPFSERLETISSNRSVYSTKSTPRPALYTPRSEIPKAKPWEAAAAKKAKAAAAEVKVPEVTKPEPAEVKRGRFLGMGRKQQTPVAAC